MIDQTPGGWRLKRRGPQHAATFNKSAPVRRHGMRALRLVVTAGAWGAGLCLVIGLVAMVAEATMPTRSQHGDHYADAARSTGYTPYTRRFIGTSLGGASFSMAAHSRWELKWSYSCNAGAGSGHLTIRELGSRTGVRVNAVGAAGHGALWTYSDDRDHRLAVAGTCPWTVMVAGHR